MKEFNCYEVIMYTPYTRDSFFVRARDEFAARKWAAENLYDFMDENEDDAFIEYKEAGEDQEDVEFYESGTYQRYRDGSSWDLFQMNQDDVLEWIEEVEKPIITVFD